MGNIWPLPQNNFCLKVQTNNLCNFLLVNWIANILHVHIKRSILNFTKVFSWITWCISLKVRQPLFSYGPISGKFLNMWLREFLFRIGIKRIKYSSPKDGFEELSHKAYLHDEIQVSLLVNMLNYAKLALHHCNQ